MCSCASHLLPLASILTCFHRPERLAISISSLIGEFCFLDLIFSLTFSWCFRHSVCPCTWSTHPCRSCSQFLSHLLPCPVDGACGCVNKIPCVPLSALCLPSVLLFSSHCKPPARSCVSYPLILSLLSPLIIEVGCPRVPTFMCHTISSCWLLVITAAASWGRTSIIRLRHVTVSPSLPSRSTSCTSHLLTCVTRCPSHTSVPCLWYNCSPICAVAWG